MLAIALVVAIGTGVYGGLTATASWRQASNDASFAALRMYDLRVKLGPDSFVAGGELAAVARSVEPDAVTGADERLVLSTQVDASVGTDTILVPGRIVGVPVGAPMVNDIETTTGRALTDADSGEPSALIEHNFADFYHLALPRSIGLSGGRSVRVVGQALTPEYFIVTGERGGFLAESNFAVVFTSLETAQSLTGHEGGVNDLVLTLAPGTDRDAFQAALEHALADDLPTVSATVMTRNDEHAYQVLYDDIDSDQQFWNVLSGLVLAAAFFSAFNLISRMVESQRREIGVGMALGMNGHQLAIRPLLVGLQVALLGAGLGVGVGLTVGAAMRNLLGDVLPLPIWLTPFRIGPFATAAAIGALLPVLASLLPVWRALRVEPVDAIKPTHLTIRSGGLARIMRRVVPPGRALTRLPVRDLVRNPRRTILTMLGIGAAMASLVGVSGMLDTFFFVIDRGEAEVTASSPDRINVSLADFELSSGANVITIGALDEVGAAQTVLTLPTTLIGRKAELVSETTVLDLDGPVWHPTVKRGGPPDGIYVTAKAANDLGVHVGDVVTLHHPRRTGASAYTMVDSQVPVAGIHPNPLRFLTFMDDDAADLFGLAGVTNALYVEPATGFSTDQAERAIFELPGVASVQAARTATEQFEQLLDQFVGFLRITQVAVLILALTIAFNTSRITLDERAREHATMFAFGVPVHTVLAKITAENVLVGLFGAAIGVGGGWLMTAWMVNELLPQTAPDIGLVPHLGTGSIIAAFVIGVVAVGIAPLFLVRRLSRMDLPSTLRLVE